MVKVKNLAPPTSALRRGATLLKLSAGIARQEIFDRFLKASPASTTLERIRQAKKIVEELGRLKGAAMKLGQMLALEGRDYLPPEAVVILEKLQNEAPALPLEKVIAVIDEDLGERRHLLVDLSPSPVAAASIGQVHTAKYLGRKVAVKIQYPGIRETVGSDLAVLKNVLNAFVRLFRPELRIDGVIEELQSILIQETDYLEEAKLATEYRHAAESLPDLIVPRIYSEVCGPRVLTLDYCEGKTIPRWLREDQPDLPARERVAHLLLDLYIREFMEWGLVQTDPNPGNFLIQPDTGKIVLLDFGATRRYSAEFRKLYATFVGHAIHRNSVGALEIAARLSLLDPKESEESRNAFLELTFASAEPFLKGKFRFGDPEFLKTIVGLSQKFARELKHTAPPREFLFLHRKLSGLYHTLAQLEVALDLSPYLSTFLR